MDPANYDNCSYCGQRILRGAMRCMKCGRILKTPEEQIASIQKLRESKKSFNTDKLIKFIILLFAIGLVYYFFSEQIIEFLHKAFSK